MVVELTIIPLGCGRSLSGAIADLEKIIEGTDLDYRMTAFGTLEGTWEELLDVAKRCHFQMRGKSEGVLTMMRLDSLAIQAPRAHLRINRSRL